MLLAQPPFLGVYIRGRLCCSSDLRVVHSPQTRTPFCPTNNRPLSLVTQAGNCLVSRFQVRPARGKVPPPAKDSGAVTFQCCAGWMIPAFGAEQQLPGKLILSIVDFCRRLQLCVVRWPSLQPHRVQCYAAEYFSYDSLAVSARRLLCSAPLLVCSPVEHRGTASRFPTPTQVKSSQVEVKDQVPEPGQPSTTRSQSLLLNPTNSST